MQALQTRDTSSLRAYLAIVRRRRWTVLVVVVLVLALAIGYIVSKTPIYQASAQLQLTPQVASAVLQANNSNAASAKDLVDVPTAIEVLESRSVADRVKRSVPGAPAVTVAQLQSTNVVDVVVRSVDARLAARAADAYARAYVAIQQSASFGALSDAMSTLQRRIESLQTTVSRLQEQLIRVPRGDLQRQQALQSQISSLQQTQTSLRTQVSIYQTAASLSTGGGQLVGEATVPSRPVVPKPVQYIVFALIVGLIAGVAIAFLREQLDDSVHSTDELTDLLGEIPVLGAVPRLTGRATEREGLLVARDQPRSPAAEAYRLMRTALQFRSVDEQQRVLQVTSPGPGDGKTTTVSNLALTISQLGRRVVLVDCDLRRPRIQQVFGQTRVEGFTSVLLGKTSLREAVEPVEGVPGLDVLGPGPLPPYPSELLSSERAQSVLRELTEMYDFVLIDSPPVLPVTDALVLTRIADVVIVVASAGTTSKRGILATLDSLAKGDAPIGGVVLNRIDAEGSDGYAYGYGYGDAYRSDPIDEEQFEPGSSQEDVLPVPVDAAGTVRVRSD